MEEQVSSQSQPSDDASGAVPHEVYTYSSGSERLPVGERALARIKMPMLTGAGKARGMRMDWHPVMITGATQEEAREKAEAWFAAEIEKERQRVAANQRRSVARRAAAEARQ